MVLSHFESFFGGGGGGGGGGLLRIVGDDRMGAKIKI